MSPGNIASPPVRSASISNTLSASVFSSAHRINGYTSSLGRLNALFQAAVAGIIFAVAQDHQNSSHALALGIRVQLSTRERYRIEQGSSSAVSELFNSLPQFSRV